MDGLITQLKNVQLSLSWLYFFKEPSSYIWMFLSKATTLERQAFSPKNEIKIFFSKYKLYIKHKWKDWSKNKYDSNFDWMGNICFLCTTWNGKPGRANCHKWQIFLVDLLQFGGFCQTNVKYIWKWCAYDDKRNTCIERRRRRWSMLIQTTVGLQCE